ncbi:hypothetical protein MTR_4g069530 [Medicago truncatula]|uniref:Uncharacterized protein n=1 Tax=Medicago truncatula TaxID=3880 RepID=A0A072UX46_MEDTR|nr:hypothetical protein MTR_4g069530 [Medicago truncatula]
MALGLSMLHLSAIQKEQFESADALLFTQEKYDHDASFISDNYRINVEGICRLTIS